MYIKKISATGVYGFLELNIDFNKDFSFITGFNGSGKTTAIRLLNALLTPSAKDLNLIPFESISVSITHRRKSYTINANRTDSVIRISIPRHFKGSATIRLIANEEIEYRFEETERGDEYFNSLILEQRDNKIINFLLDIPSPIFLGLERKILTDDPFDPRSKRRRYIGSSIKPSHIQKIMRSNLGFGLLEVQDLVRETTKRIRRNIDEMYEQQKNELIKNSFTYTKLDDVFETGFSMLQQEEKLLERRQEIENTLRNMRMLDQNLKSTLQDFFSKVAQIQEKAAMSEKKEDFIDIEWLINKAQINRINKFINIVDASKEKIDVEYAPIREFISLINSYFKESGKKISIDPIGQILINRPNNKNCGIEGLSSGEKQIMIIFANSILRKRKGTIYIIDEPELSLHVGWQERFISDIQNIQSGAQYIFATHSPEIIAEFEHKCMGVNK